MQESHENKMRQIRIEKVTVNICTGEPGEELKKAAKIIETITNATPIKTKAKVRLPKWNIRPGLEIGVKTTLRKEKARKFLEKALKGIDNQLSQKQFDKNGNFGFGIKEYIDIPGVKYDPNLGIKGMDVLVTLQRPGYRTKKRKLKKTRPGKKHLITKKEGIEFAKKELNITIKEEVAQ